MELLKPDINSENTSVDISANPYFNEIVVVDKYRKAQKLLTTDICTNFWESHEIANISHFTQEDHQHYNVSKDELVDDMHLDLQASDSPYSKSSVQVGSALILEDVNVDILPTSEDSAQVGYAQSF